MTAPLATANDYLRRTHRLLEEGRHEDVVRAAEDGLLIAPTNAGLLYNLGLALAQMDGQKERAIAALGLIRAGEREVVEPALFLRASLLNQQGRNEEAIEVLDAAFGSRPTNEDALLLRARLLEGLGDNAGAEDILKGAMSAGRRRVGVELAALMLREGRYAEARDVASEAMATA